MFDFLKIPYYEQTNSKIKILNVLLIGLFISFFLFIFQPLGLSGIASSNLFFICLGYGLTTSFIVFIFSFLIDPFIINEKWTIGKNILREVALITTIGISNFFFYISIFDSGIKGQPIQVYLKYILLSIWGALMVGLFPIIIRYLIYINWKYKKALEKVSISQKEAIYSVEDIIIKSGSSKNSYSFNPNDVVYISSNDNYISVACIKGDSITKTHIRGTLKSVESDLKMHTQFIRCHKCYIVNAIYVEKKVGNTQNLKLIVTHLGIEIPVSRSSTSNILKKLSSIK